MNFRRLTIVAIIFIIGLSMNLKAQTPETEANKRFKLIGTLKIVVPPDYEHASCLDLFDKYRANKFEFFNHDINDENYRKVTVKLIPGQKLVMNIFEIDGRITSEGCLSFLHSQNALLVGAQGLTLAYEQAKDLFPENEYVYSFDKKVNLWKDSEGYHNVPCLRHVVRAANTFPEDKIGYNGFEFSLGDFENIIRFPQEKICVLVFFKE